MKKLFLISLLACFTCVMAWAAEVEVATISELRNAINNAANGDVIKLTADIDYGKVTYGSNLNITKSITLDGQGHTLKGAGQRQSGNSQYATVWVNQGGSQDLDVTFKDIKIINEQKTSYNDMAIQTRGKLHSLTLQNVYLESYSVPLQIGGNHTGLAYTSDITIEDSHLKALMYYPILSWNKYNLVANNTKFEGWCSLYFKGVNGSIGSRGSVIVANDCKFNAPNVHSGYSNAFGMFVCEDDGISITLNNCSMDAEQLGDQSQAILVFSQNAANDRRTSPVSLTVNGDNTYINGKILNDLWAAGMDAGGNYYTAPIPDPHPLSITITGGTYAFNPEEAGWIKNWSYETEEELYDESNIGRITIPDGYEVKEITTQQGESSTTLYRVRQIITGSTALNDNAGQNATEDIKVTEDVTLANAETVAEYVEVKGGAGSDPAETVTVTVPQGKTLEVSNGLDVTGNAEVVVEAGSTVVVGEGGIISEKPENIVIGADENGSASLLLDPKVIVNTTPNLTVKMKAKGIGWMTIAGDKSRFWHRFALPIQECTTWVKYPNKSTYVFGWNYTSNSWEQYSALTQMVPFKGYTLTADYEDLGDVEYTFTGQLAGNQNNALQFERNGFNFFGNSYTGYIDILALVDQIMGDNKIDGTVWVWGDDQNYHAVPLEKLRNGDDVYATEIAPMQTFILKQNGSENASTELNYASAVWGNPRYGNGSGAPRRAVADETTRMRIIVTAENGKSDLVMLTEDAKYSDAYEKGYDGEKFMNENALNMYATIEGTNYSDVATDNLAGKTMTIKTVESVNYTMSFAKVNGEEYAIRDNVTGAVIAMTEGATYEFAAQPNSLVENRFEIVPVAKVPTAIENAETKANAKGIYTIMGQYMGEDFNALPAGIYVVNGVKIVK